MNPLLPSSAEPVQIRNARTDAHQQAPNRAPVGVKVGVRRIICSLVVGLIFYAISDVLLWARIFERSGLYRFDDAYQTGHRAVLVGMIALGVVLLWDAGLWAAWWALAFYSLAQSGLEDLLYYWLQAKPVPASLPWLDANPLIPFHPVTSSTLLLSTGLWLAVWVVIVGLLRLSALRPRWHWTSRPTIRRLMSGPP